MIHWILFNGAAQTGKNTAMDFLAKDIEVFPPKDLIIPCIVKESVHRVVADSIHMALAPDLSYATFKDTHFFGLSGRQWVIQIIERGYRDQRREILIDLLLIRLQTLIDNCKRSETPLIVMIESCGFQYEYEYLLQRDIHSVTESVTLVSMQREGYTFEGDSREDLSHIADYVLKKPSEILVVRQDILKLI